MHKKQDIMQFSKLPRLEFSEQEFTNIDWSSIGERPHYEWYAVPPYHNEGWQIKNEEGGHVATFEDKEECLAVVEAMNNK